MDLNVINSKIKEAEEILGYTFKDKSLIFTALTHPSFANEVNMYITEEEKKIKNYEKLEFLGDSILYFIVSIILCSEHKEANEGTLTFMRQKIVAEHNLAFGMKRSGLNNCVILGKGERINGKPCDNKKILCDVAEAILAAVYMDSNLDNAKEIIVKYFINDEYADNEYLLGDSKTKIQEYAQANGMGLPEYKVVKEEGLPHEKTYYVDLYLEGKKITSGKGGSKKNASKEAAYKALKKLEIK